MAVGSGRIITACDHRARVYGMTKEEVMRRARELSLEKFQIRLPEKFLREYTPRELYGLMVSVYRGEWHRILSEWRAKQAAPAATEPVEIGNGRSATQLKLF